MKHIARILVGAILAFASICLAVWFLGILAVHSPLLLAWWKTHPSLVFFASEAIAFLPFVALLGVTLAKLFATSPVPKATLKAMLSVAVALAVSYAGTLGDPQLLISTLRESSGLVLAFLLGVPAVAFLAGRMWSNNRFERSRVGSSVS